MKPPVLELRAAVQAAAATVRGGSGEAPAQTRVERPKRENQGDYSTNVAMLLAPSLGAPPREIAERVGAALAGALRGELADWEIAGPGFLNLTLSDDWYRRATRTVLDAGDRFGADAVEPGERILIEFVSANPTGPLVAANGQAAAYGDALARILEHWGHDVWREYYFNDAGGQIRLLGESVLARARGAEIPEGGYQGEYVFDLAAAIPDVESMTPEQAAHAAVTILLGQVKATLERYDVRYDRFFSERTLHEGSPCVSGPRARDRGRRWQQLSLRRRTLAAEHQLRRRQGPGAGALGRGADVLGRRPRLPAREARTGDRAPAAAGGRRSPRLRGPDEGGLCRSGRAIRIGWRCRFSSSST